MPDGVPVAVTVTAIVLPAVLCCAAVHVFFTSAVSPVVRWRPEGRPEGGAARIAVAVLFLYFVGLLSSAAALLEEWAELDTFAADSLRCVRDVALVAAGHACWPLTGMIGQTTVWRRRSPVSRALNGLTSDRWPRWPFVGLLLLSFVLSVAATIAWPQPRPWRIRPPPPLRTALIALPGPTVFVCVLLLTACFGANPWAEAVSVMGAAMCVLGAVAVTLVPWDGQLPLAFDERAMTNVLLTLGVLSSWYSVLQWTQRNPRRKRSSLNDSLLPSNGAGVSKNGRGKAGTGSAVSSALLLSAAPCTGTAANCGPGGPVGPVDAVLSSLTNIFSWAGTSAEQKPQPSEAQPKTLDSTSARDPAAVRQENAITALWFAKGLLDSIPGVALRQFVLQDLMASPASQAVIFSVVSVLPWNLKFFAAFVSDTFPICGRRRLPYMVAGLCGQALCWTLLATLPPSEGLVAGLVFMQIVSCMFMCVMLDTMTVEAMNLYERGNDKGKLQTSTWLWGTIGGLAGNLLGGWMLDYWPGFSYTGMMLFRACMVSTELIIVIFLSDPKLPKEELGGKSLTEQIGVIWESMHENRVWKPMIFICMFSVAPGNGDAFTSFLLGCPGDFPVGCERGADCEVECPENQDPPSEWPGGREPLYFSDSEYAYVNFISGVGNVFGVWIFKRYLRNAAWRPLFGITILVSTGLSLSQLILIYGLNRKIGVPDLIFAMGDDLISVIANQFISMPIWVMMGQIVPDGAEGSIFALVSSLQTVGSTVGGSISAILTSSLGVTLDNYANLPLLTIVCSLSKLAAIPFILLVPANIHKAKEDRRPSTAGAVGLAVTLFGGIAYAVATAIWKLTHSPDDV